MIDSHVNLHHEAFGPDLEAVMARAQAAGVDGMLTICDKATTVPILEALTRNTPRLWHSVGVHPHYASDHLDLTPDTLIEWAKGKKVVGIGETGLDFHYMHSPKADQVQVFQAHIDAARATQLPLIVHTRDADLEMAEMLETQSLKGRFPVLLHCYTSGLDLLERALALGAYVAFSGIATFKTAQNVRDAVALVPLDRVLMETDCPYLAPVPMRGRRNEPAFVTHVCDFLAEIYGVSPPDFAKQADANFFALFRRAQ